MKSAFFKFFVAIFALLGNLFTASKGYERKVNIHNQEAYQQMREKLYPFAEKFLLPVCKRDKDGVLIKDKLVKKYEKFIEERKAYLLNKRRARRKLVLT